jgi:DNA-binding transcriptional LysR family regulator
VRAADLAKVDLNLLVACDALLAERSVTRAAKRLGVTQSSASHALARLRDLFGDPLLVRSGHAMVLTPRAEGLARPVHEALGRLAELLAERPAFEPKTARLTFTISTSDYGALVVVPRLVERLAARAPGVDLVVRPPSNDVARHLEAGAFDVALGPITDAPPALVVVRAFDDAFVCVVRAGHPSAKEGLALADFLALPHVVVAPRGLRPSHVDVALSRIGERRRVAVLVPHFLMAPHVVARSDLVLTLPRRLADLACASLPLARHEPPIDVDGFTFQLAWHERRQRDAAHAWLRAELLAVCKGL